MIQTAEEKLISQTPNAHLLYFCLCPKEWDCKSKASMQLFAGCLGSPLGSGWKAQAYRGSRVSWGCGSCWMPAGGGLPVKKIVRIPGADQENNRGIMYPAWLGNAPRSPKKSWGKWGGKRTCGLLCLTCYQRAQRSRKAAKNVWMEKYCMQLMLSGHRNIFEWCFN